MSVDAPLRKSPARVFEHRAVDPQVLARLRAVGLSALQARIVAARMDARVEDVRRFLWPTSRELHSNAPRVALTAAAQRLASALVSAESIQVLSRADAQGVYAQALCASAFLHRAANPNVRVHAQFARGLDESYAQQLLGTSTRPSLLLVCALSTSTPAALARLQAAGIDVIVIDAERELARAALNQAFVLQPAAGAALSATLLLWQLLAGTEGLLAGGVGVSGAGRGLLDLVACALLEEEAQLTIPAHRAAVRFGLLELAHTQRPCWQVMDAFSTEPHRALPALTADALNARLRTRAREHPELALQFLSDTDRGSLSVHWALLNLDAEARAFVQAFLADAEISADHEPDARELLDEPQPIPHYLSDGVLAPQELTLATFDELRQLEPHGAGFAAASFDGRFKILSVRPVNGEPQHLDLTLLAGEQRIAARWWQACMPGAPLPAAGSYAHFLYRLGAEQCAGARQLQLAIEARIDVPVEVRERVA
jgi:hypothetical protein